MNSHEETAQMLNEYREQKTNSKLIEWGIEQLREPERTICTMFYTEHMKAEKIALNLNYDISTIFRHKKKAVEILGKILERG